MPFDSGNCVPQLNSGSSTNTLHFYSSYIIRTTVHLCTTVQDTCISSAKDTSLHPDSRLNTKSWEENKKKERKLSITMN